jgi:D-glycero-D-manno-heptose 1,7-bisphosphate phosphatase
MKYAIILERDGVLNHTMIGPKGQIAPLSFNEFRINPEVIEPLHRLKNAGYRLIVTTSQPGLSRGVLPRRELDMMHSLLRSKLPLDDILVCPHDEADRCPCRKPQTGLLTEAAFKWHLDLERSFVVSDKWQDAAAAQVAGCLSVLIKSPWNGKCHHDFVAESFNAAATKILTMQVPTEVEAYAAQAIA